MGCIGFCQILPLLLRIFTSMKNRDTSQVADHSNTYSCGFPCTPFLVQPCNFSLLLLLTFATFDRLEFISFDSSPGIASSITSPGSWRRRQRSLSSIAWRRSPDLDQWWFSSRTCWGCSKSGTKLAKQLGDCDSLATEWHGSLSIIWAGFSHIC